MLTIAIISLSFFVIGMLVDIFSDGESHSRAGLGSIMVLSWWDISFPTAIILLCIASIWLLICIILKYQGK